MVMIQQNYIHGDDPADLQGNGDDPADLHGHGDDPAELHPW